MKNELYDVIVVGAGPGGSAAAISLAQSGWNVLLVEKGTFPRDKVCGDFISPRSLRVLGALGCLPALEQAQPNRLHGATLYLDGEEVTAGTIPQVDGLSNYGYTLPRYFFDEVLFRQARRSGVHTLEDCTVTDLNLSPDCAVVQARHQGQPTELRARLVIGADGAHSAIARALGKEARDSKSIIVALRTYYAGIEGDPSQAEIFFDRIYFPGYAWIFPTGNGRANVGLGMVMDVYQQYKINLRERFSEWIKNDPVAQRRLGRARLDGLIAGWPLHTYRASGGNYAERVLLIGDAAGFVDPINGEGIHTALESARIAANVADLALKADVLTAGSLSLYEQEWRRAFELDLRTSDLIVTIIKNRPMTGVWLLLLKMIGEKALTDRAYADTCGGILSGVVPTQYSLSPEVMVKTLLHGPEFWMRNIDIRLDQGLAGLMSSGLGILSRVMDSISEMAQQPAYTAEWGVDVATKGMGLLARMSKEYTDIELTGLFSEFLSSWLTVMNGKE